MAESIRQPLVLPTGFDRRSTPLLAEGRYVSGDYMRSNGGVMETMGGWAKFDTDSVFLGICRAMLVWRSLDDTKIVALGTHRQLYHWASDDLTNITPIRASGTLGSDPLTTVDGSAVVTVAHTSHELADGAFATLGGATAVGGITPDGEYEVTVTGADAYEITHSAPATSSATGGGASVTYSYEINPGLQSSIDAYGYGVGTYGSGTYGTERTAAGILLRARTWDMWNYGEDFLACPRDGNIYQYDTSAGGRAAILSNAPTSNLGIFVPAERHVVAIGAGSERMRVEWSDSDDNTVWTAAADNQAGGQSLEGGSELMAATPLTSGVNLIWSDSDVFRMVFLGQEPWYGFTRLAGGGGLIGPLAWAEIDGIAYWMSHENFYLYDGFVRQHPTQDDVTDVVFAMSGAGIDRQQEEKVTCFVNLANREIWWLYQCFACQTGEIDRYVMLNVDEQAWYTGPWSFTVGTPARIFDYPLAAGADGYIYQTDFGADADGVALEKNLLTGLMDLSNGEVSMDIFGFWPDLQDLSGTLYLTVLMRDYPADDPRESGPYEITSATGKVDIRADGRLAQLKFVSNELGGGYRMGRNAAEVKPKGKRR